MHQSPLQPIILPQTEKAGVQLYLKRDDLIHPLYGGNKIRKLKYNVQQCLREGKIGLLTCGGAYSNHIIATAAYGKEHGLKTKAIIRGEELLIDNPTLKDAAALGMEFVFVSRETYRSIREQNALAFDLSKSNYNEWYFIPEGGTNAFAVEGIAELVAEIEIPFDYIATPCGTGGTFAGLMKGIKVYSPWRTKLLVFSALKNGNYIIDEVAELLKADFDRTTLELFTSEYVFGGYGKVKPELIAFVKSFEHQTGILLDPIYNGKMMFGLLGKIESGYFKKGSVIVAIHTGGIQAWRGFNNNFT
ncbi:1-aminocyclopropane-1-carboxylate deaminase/D-cysteine desulfhydrase [Cytophaga hutchinsonii]|uniref:1-aminocyclopropane-1-carboxylate deaminase n=1 Tax=Cytophaga hutchinsonii (strain ATCC 33406 / DSM 1761 / CIP 103989 / NBRC 15051 / NCIMB 9469 / D465) TaxID=269798 RepID=A0A6N4SW72_CYTH3|nr:pyridoxal-phosphate dependent enzyme [Cytophaga hutchinsonii]ABG60713.1 1-aminocyclopropane-1-carboxylate deaminase [Cytophaga hutchinsonii ATCC 33406]SFX70228.1 1-aminocyclopropane-1-carboxylate deaminase [Cytophaga hutchinsonii ATCC 33406]